MHYTPKKTLEMIVQCNGHYLMCVKGNQKKLHQGLQAIAQTHKPIDIAQTHEQAHGRNEHRVAMLYDQVDGWRSQWPGVARLICLYRYGEREQKHYAHCHYYITDLDIDAQTAATLVRGHWSIENQLHWPKDIVLGEDKATQRTGDSPANWSFIRNIFINLSRRSGFTSIAQAKRFFANRPMEVLLSLT